MAKVKIQGHASGSGVITIQAPNTSTDRTITLPDTTGTLLDTTSGLDATKLSGNLPAINGASLTNIAGKITAYGTDTIHGGGFNSASYTATGCSVTLNRTAGTKVLIWFAGGAMYNTVQVFTTIKRGSVDLGRTAGSAGGTGSGSGLQRFTNNQSYLPHAICTIDAATDISGSTVYEVYAKNISSATWEMVHNNWSGEATLIVMEIS